MADPNRLMGRGRGMAEKLKQEEKARAPHPLPPLAVPRRCH